ILFHERQDVLPPQTLRGRRAARQLPEEAPDRLAVLALQFADANLLSLGDEDVEVGGGQHDLLGDLACAAFLRQHQRREPLALTAVALTQESCVPHRLRRLSRGLVLAGADEVDLEGLRIVSLPRPPGQVAVEPGLVIHGWLAKNRPGLWRLWLSHGFVLF